MLNLALSRQEAGLALEQIADATKISLRFLRAIEEEEFEKLPGGIFSTSYIRQYAMAIGYDETELLEHYRRKMSPPATEKGVPRENGNRSLLDRWLGAPAPLQR